MIEKINLSTFQLQCNHVLIKVDPKYDFVEIDGPEGKKLDLQIITFAEKEAFHYSISGTILAVPESTHFYGKKEQQEGNYPYKEFQSLVKLSLSAHCHYPAKVGDRVFFNYNTQINAEEEYRLVSTEEHGVCMLMHLNFLFGYEVDGQLKPLNGYVFFERDQEEDTTKLESGILLLNHVAEFDAEGNMVNDGSNKYKSTQCTVIDADEPVRDYIDGQYEPKITLEKGQRFLIDKRFGYRIAFDSHAYNLYKYEVCQRKDILALLVDGEFKTL